MRRRAAALSMALAILFAPRPGFPQPAAPADPETERQRIFERAFGRPGGPAAPRPVLELPLFYEGVEIGRVQARNADDPARSAFRADALLLALQPILESEAYRLIAAARDEQGEIAGTALRAAGIDIRVDPRTASLVLDVPLERRRLRDVPLRGRPPQIGGEGPSPPATFSSYLNAFTAIDYVHEAPGMSPGRQPIAAAFESGTNFKGLVLEAFGNYFESAPQHFQRGDVRIIWDDVDTALRYSAGDLFYPLAGLQGSRPVGGLSITRNYALQPYLIVQPSGGREFLLQSESRVEVFVNGRRTETLRLPAGRFNLRDFPLSQGVNDVQLRITDAVGRVNVVDIPFFFAPDLLGEGIDQYSINAGVAYADSQGLRRYDDSEPVFSSFYRVGITDSLTVGGNAQGDKRVQQLGGEVGVATLFGTLRTDLVGSRFAGTEDFAARFLYSYQLQKDRFPNDFDSFFFSAGYTGPNFIRLGQLLPDNPFSFELAARYDVGLPYDFAFNVNGSYQFARGPIKDQNSVGLGVRQRITDNVSWSVDLQRNTDLTGDVDYRALVGLSVIFDRPRQFVTSSYDTASNAARATYAYLPEQDLLSPSAIVSVGRSKTSYDLNAEVDYRHYRFDASLVHDESLARTEPGGGPSRSTGLRFGTAAVFADGHFTVSRPITDSFVLVVPHPRIADREIGADLIGGQYRAVVDRLGPGVVPDLTSYIIRTVKVEVPDLPIGFEQGRDIFQLQPSYRSGTVLNVGTGATVLLDGTLVDGAGSPVALVGGLARPLNIPGAREVPFFTNRSGRFRIEGIQEGRYELTFPDLPGAALAVTVPPGSEGIVRIGRQTVTRPP